MTPKLYPDPRFHDSFMTNPSTPPGRSGIAQDAHLIETLGGFGNGPSTISGAITAHGASIRGALRRSLSGLLKYCSRSQPSLNCGSPTLRFGEVLDFSLSSVTMTLAPFFKQRG
jgi:hypothetical protein